MKRLRKNVAIPDKQNGNLDQRRLKEHACIRRYFRGDDEDLVFPEELIRTPN